METIGSEDVEFERTDERTSLEPALAALPDREQQILKLRFEEGLTQTQIAEQIGISQMHVSRLIRRSLERMRAQLSLSARRATSRRLAGSRAAVSLRRSRRRWAARITADDGAGPTPRRARGVTIERTELFDDGRSPPTDSRRADRAVAAPALLAAPSRRTRLALASLGVSSRSDRAGRDLRAADRRTSPARRPPDEPTPSAPRRVRHADRPERPTTCFGVDAARAATSSAACVYGARVVADRRVRGHRASRSLIGVLVGLLAGLLPRLGRHAALAR